MSWANSPLPKGFRVADITSRVTATTPKLQVARWWTESRGRARRSHASIALAMHHACSAGVMGGLRRSKPGELGHGGSSHADQSNGRGEKRILTSPNNEPSEHIRKQLAVEIAELTPLQCLPTRCCFFSWSPKKTQAPLDSRSRSPGVCGGEACGKNLSRDSPDP